MIWLRIYINLDLKPFVLKFGQVDDAFNQLMNEISMITEEISSKASHNRSELNSCSSQSPPPPLSINPIANFSILSTINLEKSNKSAPKAHSESSPSPPQFPQVEESPKEETAEVERLNVVRLAESSECGDENMSCSKTTENGDENDENDADESDELTSLNDLMSRRDDSTNRDASIIVNELEVTVRRLIDRVRVCFAVFYRCFILRFFFC